jgi:uncharacterized RmlC-like cupin family protein
VKKTYAIGTFRVLIGAAQMTMALVTMGLSLRTGANLRTQGASAITLLLVVGNRITFKKHSQA